MVLAVVANPGKPSSYGCLSELRPISARETLSTAYDSRIWALVAPAWGPYRVRAPPPLGPKAPLAPPPPSRNSEILLARQAVRHPTEQRPATIPLRRCTRVPRKPPTTPKLQRDPRRPFALSVVRRSDSETSIAGSPAATAIVMPAQSESTRDARPAVLANRASGKNYREGSGPIQHRLAEERAVNPAMRFPADA